MTAGSSAAARANVPAPTTRTNVPTMELTLPHFQLPFVLEVCQNCSPCEMQLLAALDAYFIKNHSVCLLKAIELALLVHLWAIYQFDLWMMVKDVSTNEICRGSRSCCTLYQINDNDQSYSEMWEIRFFSSKMNHSISTSEPIGHYSRSWCSRMKL